MSMSKMMTIDMRKLNSVEVDATATPPTGRFTKLVVYDSNVLKKSEKTHA